MKTMDYREFLGMCLSWKIFPGLLTKTQLTDIFKVCTRLRQICLDLILLNKSCSAAHTNWSLAFGQEANMSDSNDQEGHELTFDEWKLANIEIASALKLPSKDVEENSRGQEEGVEKGWWQRSQMYAGSYAACSVF
jgi:hypothetical protein